jgi:hypothetical protein
VCYNVWVEAEGPRIREKMTKVFVDDHFHYQDEDHRYEHGEFDNPDEAVAVCKQIVDRSLEPMLKANPNITAEGLFQIYAMFGEDPFVIPGNAFSAWDYAKDRCEVLTNLAYTANLAHQIATAPLRLLPEIDAPPIAP